MDTKTKGRRFTPITKVNESVKNEFQTPAAVAEYMAQLVPFYAFNVLEPTPGIGNIVTACERLGFEVTAPADFFAMDKKQFDCIVMNPPFSSKYAFNIPADFEHTGMRLGYYMLTECMKMSDNVIALMPWFTLTDSDVRLRALKEFGLKSETALPRKTFQYARIQTCVIHLQKGYPGDTDFKVFNF
jgi:hypothetical protein